MTGRVLAFLAVPVVVAGLIVFGDNYLLRLATTVAMYVALATAWNIVGGFSGYPSFATAAFFGLGAYAGGIALTAGVPLIAAWVGAGVVTALFALLLGLAILHLRGHYFAIGSLVVADVLREVTNSWTTLTGGGMGLNVPLVGGSSTTQAQLFLVAMATVAVLALLASLWIDRARLGVALRCIEQNEDAAQVIGVDTRRAKVTAFAISSLFIGAAGAIYASWTTYIDPTDVYDVSLSVKPIIMALLGGVGTIIGPVIGAFVFLGLEELIWRNSLEFHAGILGLLVVALVLFLPGGLRDLRGRGLWAWLRRSPPPKPHAQGGDTP
ncbi:branched-chain amino acid ABC transporter permease [Bradyrhizobium sp. U87765 SZCCT0131]|uniref:branched-chain amino acid ABC transporter permease n=1 Tax=unclassified Bradyrhizobium TaxID=2631580 RepID=UPI001BA9647D|nr:MULTISPECIES: branched-chain amino acid ABC transporter permease [unclassified Bradyrhizobium]MBR1218895.1 branched-chain amino acid ABC transporter permease [Bradyrhizobium sp. U87765 SZCCT0131]MBR1261546.1 branched-chain amino acid ABC transporter permease [Bradyrhizobium sp. U87765 SZCCT0134]MBR1306601.1 branched-chain amino acid ABC transporter permease [Bradyrhizobium sp. U87765 SZCCT0110]MBR1317328.1 branched-chain amino acid ABC transporter permease [Bradyrhizobium sp. U87765 SZCCT010